MAAFAVSRRDEGLPTPRELNQFVNQLAVMRELVAPDVVSLGHLAYYACLRTQGNDVVDVVLGRGDTAIPDEIERRLGTSLRESLAAIHFGTDRETAVSLLLTPELASALDASNPERVSDLCGFDGFVRVLEETLDTELESPESQVRAAACLHESGLLAGESATGVVTRLMGMFDQMSSLMLSTPSEGEGLAVLAELRGGQEGIEKAISLCTAGSDEEDLETAVAKARVSAIASFADAIPDEQIQYLSSQKVEIPCAAGAYLEACADLRKNSAGEAIWPRIACTQGTDAVHGAVLSLVSEGISTLLLQATPVLVAGAADVNWREIMDAFVESSAGSLEEDAGALRARVRFLAAIEHEVADQISDVVGNGVLYRAFKVLRSKDSDRVNDAARCVWWVLSNGEPPGGLSFTASDSVAEEGRLGIVALLDDPSTEEAMVARIARFIAEGDLLAELHKLAQRGEYVALVAAVTTILYGDDNARVMPASFVDLMRLVEEVLDEAQLNDCARTLLPRGLLDSLRDNADHVEDANLFTAAFLASEAAFAAGDIPPGRDEFNTALRDGLKNVSSDSWQVAFRDETALEGLAVACSRTIFDDQGIGIAVKDAVLDWGRSGIAGELSLFPSEDRLHSVSLLVPESDRTRVWQNIWIEACRKENDLSGEFLEGFGLKMLEAAYVNDELDLEGGLVMPILESAGLGDARFAWLAALLDRVPEAATPLQEPGSPTRRQIEHEVVQAVEGDATDSPLVHIAEILGIEVLSDDAGEEGEGPEAPVA